MEDENSSKLRFLFFFISAVALFGVFLLFQKAISYLSSDKDDYFAIEQPSDTATPLEAKIIGDIIGDKRVSPTLSPIMSPKATLSPIMSPMSSSGEVAPSASFTVLPTSVVQRWIVPSPSLAPAVVVSPIVIPTPTRMLVPTPIPTPIVAPTPTQTLASPTPSPMPAEIYPVVISEIAWMGTSAATNDEWIELYNPNDTAVSLSGLSLKTADGGFTLGLSKSIPARGYYLIERGADDNAIFDIKADLAVSFSNAGLNNSGEVVQLVDGTGQVIDEVNCSSGWFAGNNDTKSSMEKINLSASGSDKSNWKSNDGLTRNGLDSKGNAVGGTPGQRNSVASF